MAEVADHHFWFRGTRRVILDQARQHVGADLESLQIADIGCGPGTTLRWLSHCPNVVGVDLQPVAIELAIAPLFQLIKRTSSVPAATRAERRSRMSGLSWGIHRSVDQ